MLPQYFFVYISFHSLKFFGSLSSHFIGNVSHISMVYYNAVNFYNRVSLSNLNIIQQKGVASLDNKISDIEDFENQTIEMLCSLQTSLAF